MLCCRSSTLNLKLSWYIASLARRSIGAGGGWVGVMGRVLRLLLWWTSSRYIGLCGRMSNSVPVTPTAQRWSIGERSAAPGGGFSPGAGRGTTLS